MSARTKLNIAFINGSVFIAAIAGGIAESWAVFWFVAIVLIAGDVYLGYIRPGRRPDSPRR